MSLDPVVGCPFSCRYCVLRHSDGTGKRPTATCTPQECVDQLLRHPLFVRDVSRLAIGNETDMLHQLNVDYLVELLRALQRAGLTNTIALITKARLDAACMRRIRAIEGPRICFFLSYSGLGPAMEPNFTDEGFRANFEIVKEYRFPLLHYWRPLLPGNTTVEAVERMLSFVPLFSDGSIIVGFKLHPELTAIVTRDGEVPVPAERRADIGEWFEPEAFERILSIADRLCPDYPLYRHTSCGLAKIMSCRNHTGTMYREDICQPSHCPPNQRAICAAGRRSPEKADIEETLRKIGRSLPYSITEERLVVSGELTQEEYSYLVQALGIPVFAAQVRMQNLYFGSINEGRWLPPKDGME